MDVLGAQNGKGHLGSGGRVRYCEGIEGGNVAAKCSDVCFGSVLILRWYFRLTERTYPSFFFITTIKFMTTYWANPAFHDNASS